MPHLKLTRIEMSVKGTFGELHDDYGDLVCVTCERPDNGNKPMGCIPLGSYGVTPFTSPSKGKDFLVHNVPNRDMIEIHVGNTIADTEGCILVGEKLGYIDTERAVMASKEALAMLLAKFPNGFTLEIVDARDEEPPLAA